MNDKKLDLVIGLLCIIARAIIIIAGKGKMPQSEFVDSAHKIIKIERRDCPVEEERR